MKHVKSLLALVLTLMLICGIAVVPATAAEGQLVGDAKLFLPSTGAIKVQYTLTTDGTTTVDGATYEISKIENADNSEIAADDIWKYAQIDAATGELYVSQAAKGKEIFLSATSADYTGSTSVVVSDVSYGTDFEDETVGETVSNPIFTGTAAKTITEGQMKSVYGFAEEDLTKTNKIGHGHHKATGDAYSLVVRPDNMKSEKITIEATVAVHKQSDFGESVWWPAMNYPVVVTFGTGSFTINLANNKVETRVNGSWKANAGLVGYGADFYYQMIPLKVVIEDNKTVSVTANSTPSSVVVAADNTAATGITSISFESFVDDIAIYSGERASEERFEAYKLEGLDKLYLPASGTGKVTYVMKDRNGATVSGATYSISGDSNLGTYALMDAATGELLINSAASGKTINVTAQIGEDTVTKTITTDRIYVDFENETIGSAVTNSAFSSKSATVVANGSGKAAAASSATGLAMSFADFDYPNYTMEANISTDQGGTLVTVNQAGASGSTRYFTEVPKDKPNERNLCFKGNVTDWSADTRGGSFAFTTGAYYPFTLKVTDYYKATASWNNIVLSNTYLWGHNASSTAAAYTDLSSIAFGTMVDDIQIYNVDKASGSYAISGQTGITRAPIGTSANFAYKAAASLPWATGEGLTWGISGSYTGVSVNEATGVVTVAGSAATGTFTLQLKEGGAVVAEKAVKIVDATDQWVDDKSRTFLDFENQSDYVGKAPAHRITGVSNYNDIPLSFERRGESSLTKEEDLVTGVIQQESNGNLYVTALGQAWWGANGSTFRFYPYGLKDRKWLEGAESATLEADFMIESDKMSTRLGERYSLLSENLATGATVATASDIEVSYRYFADGTAGIYTGYWTKDEEGGDITAATLVGVVNADEWFNVRLEFNFVNKTYDLYVNNQKLAVAEPIKKDHIECFYVGAAIDNIAAYHGAKAVDEVALTTSFKDGVAAINDAAFATAIAVNETEIKTISVTLGEAAPAGVSDNAKLIIAQYSGDKMVKMTSVPVSVVNGKLYGCAALTAEYAAGDTVKAFLWNWGTLQPVK